MYFPLFILPGWGKRSAIQPRTIESAVTHIQSSTTLPEFPLFMASKPFSKSV